MLNSLSEKLVSYVSSPSDVRGDDTAIKQVAYFRYGAKHKKRCEKDSIDVEFYSHSVKKRKTEEGFVQKVTNSVSRMAEWLLHSKNYFFGRHNEAELNLKTIDEEEVEEDEDEEEDGKEEEENVGQRLDDIHARMNGNRNNECNRFLNRLNSNKTSRKQDQERLKHENKFLLHRPSIINQSKSFVNQEPKSINGNMSSVQFLYSSKSQTVSLLSQSPFYNRSQYTISPGVRINCSNSKPVALSNDRLYSLPRHHRIRNDVGSVQQKPHMHTAAQCVRLEEKERYRRLIQQFSRGDILAQPLSHQQQQKHYVGKNDEKDRNSIISKTSRRSSSSSEDQNPLKISNLLTTPTLTSISDTAINNTFTEMPIPKQKINFSDSESLDENLIETEKSSENSSSKSSSQHCVQLKNNPYLAEDWVTQLVKKYSASTREQKRKIEEERLKIKIFETKRKTQEENLNEEIQRRLQLSEKEPAILEEKEIQDDQPPSLPEITTAMRCEIDSALKPHPSNEVLVEGFRIQIKRQDMTTLSGLNWLNDEVINFYLSLLMERSQNDKTHKFPKVYSFNTFFYPKLQSSGYEGVRRWTRKVDIFAVKYLLIPVHLGMHWCLAVVNFSEKTICYYDSMGGKNPQCLDTIKKYLCDESLDKKKTPFNLVGWITKMARDIPHQMNGSDCGMFACKYADYITREIPISFTQADMPQFRRLMCYEILKKKLLT